MANKYFSSHKREIISAIIGALFAGVISLGVGLYNLNRQFEIAYVYELRDNLKSTLDIMQFVNREFDKNLSLLMNQKFTPTLKYKEVNFKVSISEEKLNDYINGVAQLVTRFTGFDRPQQILNSYIPSENFGIHMANYIINARQVDYLLRQDLFDYYQKLGKINDSLNSIRSLSRKGAVLSIYNIERIQLYISQINEDILSISKEKIISLKNRTQNEIRKLEKKYASLS